MLRNNGIREEYALAIETRFYIESKIHGFSFRYVNAASICLDLAAKNKEIWVHSKHIWLHFRAIQDRVFIFDLDSFLHCFIRLYNGNKREKVLDFTKFRVICFVLF